MSGDHYLKQTLCEEDSIGAYKTYVDFTGLSKPIKVEIWVHDVCECGLIDDRKKK